MESPIFRSAFPNAFRFPRQAIAESRRQCVAPPCRSRWTGPEVGDQLGTAYIVNISPGWRRSRLPTIMEPGLGPTPWHILAAPATSLPTLDRGWRERGPGVTQVTDAISKKGRDAGSDSHPPQGINCQWMQGIKPLPPHAQRLKRPFCRFFPYTTARLMLELGNLPRRTCQWRWEVGPLGRSKTVPLGVIGQHKCPH